MKQKLKKLFDYQRFEKNSKLAKLIHEAETQYATELSDEELSLVNAAGEYQNGTIEVSSGNDPAGIDGKVL